MSDNLTEIKGPNCQIITIGMDARIGNNSLWGKVEKITNAWNGTIFVRVPGESKLRKFCAFNRYERTSDEWSHICVSFYTPEQKCAFIDHANAEKARLAKAHKLQFAIKWEYAPEPFITSVYNLAIENKLIDAPQVPH